MGKDLKLNDEAKAVVGDVGLTSTSAWPNAAAKSLAMRRRTFWACP